MITVPGTIKSDVLFGEDGWFFLWQGGHYQFDHLLGKRLPSPESVKNFSDNLAVRRESLARRGVKYVHVVFPSKPVVMTEFLPAEYRGSVRSLFETAYEPALGPMAALSMLYPREALLKEKAKAQLFRKTDTHMTSHGSAVVVREMLRHLGCDHDPLDYMEPQFVRKRADLSDMAGIGDAPVETILAPKTRSTHVFDNRPALPGNTNNLIVAYNPRSRTSQRLLAIGDSFLTESLPHLSTFYRDILFVRSTNMQPDLLWLFQPDHVISANAERYLTYIPADPDGRSILMRTYGRPDYRPDRLFSTALQAELAKAAYPSRYDDWAIPLADLTVDGLGSWIPNAQVGMMPTGGGSLALTGTDPQIRFPNPAIDEGGDFVLQMAMKSSRNGLAKLFLERQDRPKAPFGEDSSVHCEVKEGDNQLTFNFSVKAGAQQLRFDPLNYAGEIVITDMKLLRRAAPVPPIIAAHGEASQG